MSSKPSDCWKQIASLVAIVFLLSNSLATGQSADYGGYRRHYQGFGVKTPGGRGGEVCRVTSLSDSVWPPEQGTMRYCVEASSGPRFVIFEVSGTIRLAQGPLRIRYPYITVAGQTAPSPGILIRGPGVIIDTHDVVVQHVRIRLGNLPDEPHSLWLRDDAHNVVIDHVSLSWSIWTSLGVSQFTTGQPGEITVVDSIIAESLACSGVNNLVPCDPAWYPTKGSSNSRAMIIGDGAKVTLLRSISANNNDRHPEVSGGTQTFLVNNLIYNPSHTPWAGVYFQDARRQGPIFSVVKGNLLIPGPTTPGHNGYSPPEYSEEGDVMFVRIDPTVDADSRIYLDGNYYQKHCRGSACLVSPVAQWLLARDFPGDWFGVNVRASAPPLKLDTLALSSAMPYTQVEAYVTANAGARPLDRDAVDDRIISEIRARTGRVPNTPAEKAGPGTGPDGFPRLAENRRSLILPSNPHATVDDVGRTRIEAWLDMFARALEPAHARAR